MKRLIKKSDFYYEKNELNDEDIKIELTQCAEEYCSRLGINKSSISVDIGINTYVNFGDIMEDGFEISIDIYDIYTERTIDRIIASAGKNPNGQSIYVETREQSILDSFFRLGEEFYEWVQTAIEDMEDRF